MYDDKEAQKDDEIRIGVYTCKCGGNIGDVVHCEAAADWSLRLGKVAAVPVSGLELRRTVYMVRRTLETPNRPQEVFWSFVHDPSNADLLRLAGKR